jgi:hypothetical protein
MKRNSPILILIMLVVIVLTISACSQEPAATETEEPLTQDTEQVIESEQGTESVEDEVETPDSPEPTEEAEGLEENEPDENVEETSAAVTTGEDACIGCHTDKDTLIETADAVVEVESESEGAG